MSLSDKARQARLKAGASLDPADWVVAHALAAAQRAESDELLARAQAPGAPGEVDTSGIPSAEQAGFVSEVWIERGGTEN